MNDDLTTGVPPAIADQVHAYVIDHAKPGPFLVAVLCNDLMTACGVAGDEYGMYVLRIARLVFNAVPGRARGSKAAVDAWIAEGKSK